MNRPAKTADPGGNTPGWMAYMLSAASGLLLTASLPKVSLAQCVWIALVPLLFAMKSHSARESFKLGFVAGFFHFITLLYWLIQTMRTYGNLPLFLSIFILALFSIYLALYVAVFCYALVRLAPRPTACLVLAPVLWVSLEFLRAFLFSGFPWAFVGYSQYENLTLIQISDLTGVYGVSFLIVAVNAAVFSGASLL